MSGRGIEFRRVRFEYLRRSPVFRDLDLEIGPGLTLVLGANGAGKSTLLKLAAGVEAPDAGHVLVNGLDLWSREAEARRDLAYLPEQPDVTPYASVATVLRLVTRLRERPAEEAAEALRECGLEGLEARSIRQLSKGQRHRVLLAAARIGRPRTLLLDEPLAALDRPTRSLVLSWVDETYREGGLALVITHEIEPFLERAVRAVALREGRPPEVHALPEDLARRRALLEALAGSDSAP